MFVCFFVKISLSSLFDIFRCWWRRGPPGVLWMLKRRTPFSTSLCPARQQYHAIPYDTKQYQIEGWPADKFSLPSSWQLQKWQLWSQLQNKNPPQFYNRNLFIAHFFHDCILTHKIDEKEFRRSIFKQPRYLPGTTHINFSHAFRISALSYLLKKEVLFLQLWSVYRRTLLQTTYNAITKFGLISDKKKTFSKTQT